MATQLQRMTVHFTGRVQGVGFRFTVLELARTLAVTGTVRNEWDGSVTLVAEGTRDELESFLLRIHRSRLGAFIRQAHTRWTEASGNIKQFSISY
jgi:acylphosphatase